MINKVTLLSLGAVAISTTLAISLLGNNTSGSQQFHSVKKNTVAPETVDPSTFNTNSLLGYESNLSPLHSSLRDAPLLNTLSVTEEGLLEINDNIQDVFDYFLSAITEEGLVTVQARIHEYLEHYLQEPALSQSKSILEQYIQMKLDMKTLDENLGQQLANLKSNQVRGSEYVELLRQRLDQRNSLRARHLDPDVYQAFYEDEVLYDEYTYNRLIINSDETLTIEEKRIQSDALILMLPEHMQHSIKVTQTSDYLKEKTEALLKEGAQQTEIRQLRVDLLGEPAAKRFDQLDEQRAQWQTRLDDYIAARKAILQNQGIDEQTRQEQANALLEERFTSREQIRVKVLTHQRTPT